MSTYNTEGTLRAVQQIVALAPDNVVDLADVRAKLDTIDAVRAAPVDPADLINDVLLTVTAETASEVVNRLADASVRHDAARVVAGVLDESLIRQAAGLLRAKGPAVIAAWADRWNEAAAEFTAAATQLPTSNYALQPDQIVKSGGSALLALFEQAQAAADVMTELARHRGWLADIGVRVGQGDPDDATRFCVLADGADPHTVAVAARTTHPIAFLELARHPQVTELKWNTLAEQQAQQARLAEHAAQRQRSLV